jgi:hypothetical protein
LPEAAVASPAIVEDLDVLEDLSSQLGFGGPCLAVDHLFLEGREEALGDGVVIAVTPGAHRLCDPGRPCLLPERKRDILLGLNGSSQQPRLSVIDDSFYQVVWLSSFWEAETTRRGRTPKDR